MALLGLLLHLGQLILVVEHLEGLVKEAVSLQVKLLLNLHVQRLDFHLEVADDWVLVKLIVECVLN